MKLLNFPNKMGQFESFQSAFVLGYFFLPFLDGGPRLKITQRFSKSTRYTTSSFLCFSLLICRSEKQFYVQSWASRYALHSTLRYYVLPKFTTPAFLQSNLSQPWPFISWTVSTSSFYVANFPGFLLIVYYRPSVFLYSFSTT